MKRKAKWTLLTLLCIMFMQVTHFGGMTSEAAGKEIYFTSGDLYYHAISSGKVEVCGTKKNKGTLTIPESVYYNGKKYTVTRIADQEYYREDTPITEETKDGYNVAVQLPGSANYQYNREDGKRFPSDVEYIPGSGIEKVVLPDTLTYIGEGAFCFCSNLEKVEFARQYKKLTIGKNAFGGTGIKSIQFPKGTYELKDGAAGLIEKIYIPATVKKIGANVVNFKTKKVTIDKKNRKFKMKNGILYSYDEKTLLGVSAKVSKDVKISGKTKKITKQAFAGTKVKTVTLNNKITTIPKGTFYNCKNLTGVKGTDSLKTIEYAAFANCPKLISIENTSALQTIGRAAFWKAANLSLSLSANATDVDTYAFAGTREGACAKMNIAEGNPVLSVSDGFLIKTEGTDKTVIMQVEDKENIVIPEGVTDVAVFVGGSKCKSVTFPATLLVQEGRVSAVGGTIIYRGTVAPKFGADYDISISYENPTTVKVPAGTMQNYKEAIKDVINKRDGYDIWEGSEIVIAEQ